MAADELCETSDPADHVPQQHRTTFRRMSQLVLATGYFAAGTILSNELLTRETLTTRQRLCYVSLICLMFLLGFVHVMVFRYALKRSKNANSHTRTPTESTWSPFQSAEVHDICEHLTPEEKGRLASQGARLGRKLGSLMSPPLFFIALSFLYSVRVFFVLLGLFIIYAFVMEWRLVRDHQRRVRETLCAAEYAKTRGYHPDTLRMFSFPWSRRP